MKKFLKYFKKHIFVFVLLIASVPTFFRMLKPGIYSMQDFHYFRLVEYGKCIDDFVFPCRWSQDTGLGYGEPLFNFYGQAPYLFGQVFRLFDISNVDTLKILFILSLVGSALTMFVLSKKIWKNNYSALISSLLYLYAPYRAVDVWVRGALPEALSFVLFPLIVYVLEVYFEKGKLKDLITFSLLLALLILTHNLSFILFLFFLIPWIIYRIIVLKIGKRNILLLLSGFGYAALLSSFYLLPVLFESKFINLAKATTEGYFDFRGHFIGLYQMLLSRHWGYGASVFGLEDGLNLSVGIIQWVLPLLALIFLLFKKDKKVLLTTVLPLCLGWLSLFLTHYKSAFLWESIKPMAYIQFPWRFISIAVFSFSLASGAILVAFKKFHLGLALLIGATAIILSFSFFREDIWYAVGDKELTVKDKWTEQARASIGDYWPVYGRLIPDEFAPDGFDNQILLKKRYGYFQYKVIVDAKGATTFPVTFFPGWQGYSDGIKLNTYPLGDYGLVAVDLSEGIHTVEMEFVNTPIRTIGNLLSMISLIGAVVLIKKYAKK